MRKAKLIPILLCAAAWGAEAPKPRATVLEERRQRFPELVQLTELAQSVAPEFSAQALLRVAESTQLTDDDFRRELIEQAFEKAAGARQLTKVRVMGGNSTVGSRALELSQASKLGLDRTSLQVRAARDMIAMDPPRARVLFQAIPRPAPRVLSCADAMLDDFDDYYYLAAQLVAKGFTAEERRREEPVLFVNSLLAQIVSPVQVGPVSSVMGGGNFTTEQRKLLAGSLAAALQRLDGDDRAFVNSLMSARTAVMPLAQDQAVAAAWRTYLVKHFTGARCQESRDEAWIHTIEKTAVEDFNNKFANGASGSAAITLDEQKPGSVDGAAQLQKIFDREQLAQQRARFMGLMFGTTKALTDYDKSTPEWKQQFSEYLSAVEGMKGDSGEPETLFFMRKSGALKTILLASPSGPERDKVLVQYVSFLKSANLQQESPVEWFYSVESFADLTRSLSFGEYKKMLDALENSGNPILVLYAKLDRGLPSRPDWAKPAAE